MPQKVISTPGKSRALSAIEIDRVGERLSARLTRWVCGRSGGRGGGGQVDPDHVGGVGGVSRRVDPDDGHVPVRVVLVEGEAVGDNQVWSLSSLEVRRAKF